MPPRSNSTLTPWCPTFFYYTLLLYSYTNFMEKYLMVISKYYQSLLESNNHVFLTENDVGLSPPCECDIHVSCANMFFYPTGQTVLDCSSSTPYCVLYSTSWKTYGLPYRRGCCYWPCSLPSLHTYDQASNGWCGRSDSGGHTTAWAEHFRSGYFCCISCSMSKIF